MERDALIAHGTSFLLQDRLMNCSDYSIAWVCRSCGSLISLGYEDVAHGEVTLGKSKPRGFIGPNGEYCRLCRAENDTQKVQSDSSLPSTTNTLSMKMLPKSFLGTSNAGQLDLIAVPFVFRYLCAELAAMGISISLEVS
jgi:DNA-directed RNA polymerase I subunit RPA2